MLKNIIRHNWLRMIGLTSLGGLALGALLLVSPVVPSDSHAETNPGNPPELNTELTTTTSAYLYSMIAVSLSNNIDININPLATGAIGIGKAKLMVATNNTTGYKIMLSTVDGTNELKSVSSDQHFENGSTGSIKALGASTTKADYLNDAANLNTWGYALTKTEATEETVYHGLNASSTIMKASDNTTGKDEYDLNVAIAVDAELPAGAYRNGLLVSAVANPITLSGFAQIYYMQDMTPEICASAKEHEEGQLVDKRDNNIYWVAKLRDGNCWMTQNLALDITEAGLKASDTDIVEDWGQDSKYPPANTTYNLATDSSSLNEKVRGQRSYNLGKTLIKNVKNIVPCADEVTESLTESCLATYVDVEGWRGDYVAKNDKTYDDSTHSYDAHYLTGNYYQYGAATAGTGQGLSSPSEAGTDPDKLVNASGSICPKGWMLPKAGFNNDSSSPTYGQSYLIPGSFYSLLHQYDFNDWKLVGGNVGVSLTSGTGVYLSDAPLYFFPAAIVQENGLSIRDGGVRGYYTSSTMAAGNNAAQYLMYFDLSRNLNKPTNGGGKSFGVSVRCLAR